MDTIKSFKGYGKVDELEQQAFRRKTRKRLIILIVSSVVLAAVIIAAVAGTVINRRNSDSDDVPSTPTTSAAASIKAVCNVTQYPESCYSSVQALETSKTIDPKDIFELSLRAVLNELPKISSNLENLMPKISEEPVRAALRVCEAAIDDAADSLNDSISTVDVNGGEKILLMPKINDLKTWLSTAITDQETCLDALQEVDSPDLLRDVKGIMKNSTEFASNSLAIAAKLLSIIANLKIPSHRKLLGASDLGFFPDWIRAGDRKLLQETRPRPNLTVAQDGSGDCKTINEAVGKIPKKSKTRFVIYVKAGRYVENVNLEKSARNVMMYGDGSTKTVVSGSRNFVDGTPTFDTATFAVRGMGFIAKDMRFENTAGPQKHQAVAMRSGSDHSVFYRCSFDGYQDTLYAHSNRQFYRDCDISGTVDFIFGNAAVVFQNCSIQPRQPLPNQFVTITAQGKKDVNQNTGISIQRCLMNPLGKLTAPTYLGRPWKEYSTTVVMQSNIGSFLHPSGWSPWVQNVDPPGTIYYAEYQNTGPGAGVDKRVKWAGYKPTITDGQASKFTVQSLIDGNDWLPQTNVAFDLS